MNAAPWAISPPSSTQAVPSWIAPRGSDPCPDDTSRIPTPPPPPDLAEAAAEEDARLHREPEGPTAAEIEAALNERIAALEEALVAATAATVRLRDEVLAHSEGDLVRLATVIAERVLRREIALDPAVITAWAHEALRDLAEEDDVFVAIAPSLAAQIEPEAWVAALGADVAVTVDPSLSPMRCEVRAKFARVDVSVEARLAAVAGWLEGAR